VNTAPPELGLGILLAASLSPEAIMRLFKCDEREANAFKERACCDLGSIQHQINVARKLTQ
jgi:hypothetical protein